MFYKFCHLLVQVVCSAWFNVRVVGQRNVPDEGGVLLVSNHQSYLDPLLVGVGMQRQMTYMARQTLFRNVWFGWLISALGAFPVRRGGADSGAIREAVNRLQAGRVLLLFPEGTRTRDGAVGTFQEGFVTLVRRGDVPVVPVAIEGADRLWPRQNLMPRFGRVKVAYGQAISPQELQAMGREGAAEEVRRRVVELKAELARG